MAKKMLTDARVKAIKPVPGKRIDYWDAMLPGFGVRVTDKGAKSYCVYARFSGVPSRRTIGDANRLRLADARATAREWLSLAAEGKDPATAAQESAPVSFGAVMEEYLAQRRGKRAAKDEREIRHDLMRRWANKPLSSVTKQDVIKLVDEIKKRGAFTQAHNVLGHARTFFNWCLDRDVYGLTTSPCDRVKPGRVIGKKKARTRVLTDDEIRAYWRAAAKLHYPWEQFYKIAMLTGQRRAEIAEAKWSEFDLKQKLWTIPAERFKSDSTQLVPLSDSVVSILATIPRWGEYLFTTTGDKPIAGFSQAKRDLDDFMGVSDPFVLHDVRRTMRTRLSALRVPEMVCEMVIGHDKKGLQRVYNQHRFVDEMREALELWAARLRDIVEPAPVNLVQISTRRA